MKLALKLAAAAAATMVCGAAEATIVQLDFSGTVTGSYNSTHLGESFSGYLFFDTTNIMVHTEDGSGLSSYYAVYYMSSPFATSAKSPYTTKPRNPYTDSPIATNSPYPYLPGNAYLFTMNIYCGIKSCDYIYEIENDDGSYSTLSYNYRQAFSTNPLVDSLASLSGVEISFIHYSNTVSEIFRGTGTIGLPAVSSAVPEPATWAMMIAGFGLIGGAARHRRRRTTVSYA